jgi:hypothetical protein
MVIMYQVDFCRHGGGEGSQATSCEWVWDLMEKQVVK